MSDLKLRTLRRGLTGGAALRRQLYEWDLALRAPLATVLRVGVIHLYLGVGASTVATGLSSLLARRRAQPVLAVDLVGGAGGLAERLKVEPTPPSRVRSKARTSKDAADGLAIGPQGQFVLFPNRPATDSVATWMAEVAPVSRFFDVVIADFGARHPLVDLAPAASLCDVVCLVTGAGRAEAEVGVSLAAAIGELAEHPRVVLTLVDRDGAAGLAPQTVAAHADIDVVTVPFDRGLASGAAPTTLAARAAMQQLGATLVSSQMAVQK